MDIGKLDKYHFCPKFQEMLFHADSNDYEKLRSLDKKFEHFKPNLNHKQQFICFMRTKKLTL